jgi:hypothetical protein
MNDSENINPVEPVKDEPKPQPKKRRDVIATPRRSQWVGGDVRFSRDPDRQKMLAARGPFNLLSDDA